MADMFVMAGMFAMAGVPMTMPRLVVGGMTAVGHTALCGWMIRSSVRVKFVSAGIVK